MHCGRKLRIPVDDAFQMHLQVHLCKTCIDYKLENDHYKEKCRVYELKIKQLYKQLNGRGRISGNGEKEVCRYCSCDKAPVVVSQDEESSNGGSNTESDDVPSGSFYKVVREMPADVVPESLIGWPMIPHNELAMMLERRKAADNNGVTVEEHLDGSRDAVQVKVENDETEEAGEPEEAAGVTPGNNLTCCWVLEDGADNSRTCGKRLKAIQEIVPHIRDEHEPQSGVFVCQWPGCERKSLRPFANKQSMLLHVTRIHTGEERYRCPVEDCFRTFQFWDKMDEHRKQHGKTKVYCLFPGCDRVFGNTTRVHVHYRICHMGAECFRCPVDSCGLEFTSKKDREEHCRMHESAKPFSCEFPGCDYSCKDKLSLRLHAEAHGDDSESEGPVPAKRLKLELPEANKPLGPCQRGCAKKIPPSVQGALCDEYRGLGDYKRRETYLSSLIRVERRTRDPQRYARLFAVSVHGDRIEVCERCFRGIFGKEAQFLIDIVTLEKVASASET